MKNFLILILTGLVALGVAGCGSDSENVKADPEALESAFEGASEEEVVEAPTSDESTTDTIVIPADADGNVPVKEVASRAAVAIRNDEVADALVLLHSLRRARNLTADQLTAVQDQMSALQVDLANRAANGDVKAQQALQMIQSNTRW